MSQKPLKANKTMSPDPVQLVRKIAACTTSRMSGRFRRIKSLEEYDALLHDFDPSNYTNAFEFGHDYLLSNIVRKYVASDDKVLDLDTPAYRSFYETEAKMRQVNELLSTYGSRHCCKGAGESAIAEARLKILRLLGPSVPVDEFVECCSFSAGASFSMTRQQGSTAAHKFNRANPEVTLDAAPLACAVLGRSPIWAEHIKHLTLVRGNRITTVPKSRSTNRTIAIEPALNMYLQKSVGTMIRKRLKRVGIDLNDQSINQKLAQDGSLADELATVDLSAASDSVSIELCRLLLPPAWFELIYQIRSHEGMMPDGSWITYEKISSMGNGYTFELESLLFWALTVSVTKRNDTVSVYGDDIILPSYASDALVEVFSYCGFATNKDKTFVKGLFRESCGKHYFFGEDVSPVYHRSNGSSEKEAILVTILLANNLRRYIGTTGCVQYALVHKWIVSHLPEEWAKPRLPDGVGDGALIGTLAEAAPQMVSSKNYLLDGCSYRTKVLRRVAREAKAVPFGEYLHTLGMTSSDQNSIPDQKLLELWFRSARLCSLFRLGHHESESYGLKQPVTRIRKQNMRIWSWSDPAW